MLCRGWAGQHPPSCLLPYSLPNQLLWGVAGMMLMLWLQWLDQWHTVCACARDAALYACAWLYGGWARQHPSSCLLPHSMPTLLHWGVAGMMLMLWLQWLDQWHTVCACARDATLYACAWLYGGWAGQHPPSYLLPHSLHTQLLWGVAGMMLMLWLQWLDQ